MALAMVQAWRKPRAMNESAHDEKRKGLGASPNPSHGDRPKQSGGSRPLRTWVSLGRSCSTLAGTLARMLYAFADQAALLRTSFPCCHSGRSHRCIPSMQPPPNPPGLRGPRRDSGGDKPDVCVARLPSRRFRNLLRWFRGRMRRGRGFPKTSWSRFGSCSLHGEAGKGNVPSGWGAAMGTPSQRQRFENVRWQMASHAAGGILANRDAGGVCPKLVTEEVGSV